jgi:hypothetical protein
MPARHTAPRRLSEQQLKNPLIRSAFVRLGNLVSYRGQFLRRLDSVHGDRRTRLEKFVAIERVAEQLLLRLDLATCVLGYIDPANGRYVLNTQCGIAEDAGISAPALCRLLKTLDDAGYVYRRHECIRLDERDSNGQVVLVGTAGAWVVNVGKPIGGSRHGGQLLEFHRGQSTLAVVLVNHDLIHAPPPPQTRKNPSQAIISRLLVIIVFLTSNPISVGLGRDLQASVPASLHMDSVPTNPD